MDVVNAVGSVDQRLKGVEPVAEKKTAKEPTGLDLLRQAAEALDARRGMRAKSYGIAAERVREIVAWLESLD